MIDRRTFLIAGTAFAVACSERAGDWAECRAQPQPRIRADFEPLRAALGAGRPARRRRARHRQRAHRSCHDADSRYAMASTFKLPLAAAILAEASRPAAARPGDSPSPAPTCVNNSPTVGSASGSRAGSRSSGCAPRSSRSATTPPPTSCLPGSAARPGSPLRPRLRRPDDPARPHRADAQHQHSRRPARHDHARGDGRADARLAARRRPSAGLARPPDRLDGGRDHRPRPAARRACRRLAGRRQDRHRATAPTTTSPSPARRAAPRS